MPQYVNASVARALYRQGQPFRVRLEYVGRNYDNASGHSSKWWELNCRGSGCSVECNFGAIGTFGRSEPISYDFAKAMDKLNEKLGKGYQYVRGTLTSMPAPAAPAPSTPKINLTGPFALIRLIKKIADDHFQAFDGQGDFLLDLDAEGAKAVVAADAFRIEMVG